MRIDQVRVDGFGPHRDRTISFPPGLSVVWGPNESGKTSLVNALMVGLVGRRKRVGKPSLDEQRFRERFTPWAGGPWAVHLVVTLADGRTIEIAQDIADPAKSKAIDLSTHKSVSREILSDVGIDAAQWLGLDRASFAATALVSQGDVARVLERDAVNSLGSALARAATALPADSTADEGIERIRRFISDHVGAERRGSTKPLAMAANEVQTATLLLQVANQAHRAHRVLVGQMLEEEATCAMSEREVALWRANEAASEAMLLQATLDKATALGLVADLPVVVPLGTERIEDVVGAINRFRLFPPEPKGPSRPAEMVRSDLEGLATQPDALPELPSTLVESADRLRLAQSEHERFLAEPVPTVPEEPDRAIADLDAEVAMLEQSVAVRSSNEADPEHAAEIETAQATLRDAERAFSSFALNDRPQVSSLPSRSSAELLEELSVLEQARPLQLDRPGSLRLAERALSQAQLALDQMPPLPVMTSPPSTTLDEQDRVVSVAASEVDRLSAIDVARVDAVTLQRDSLAAARRELNCVVDARPEPQIGSTPAPSDSIVGDATNATVAGSQVRHILALGLLGLVGAIVGMALAGPVGAAGAVVLVGVIGAVMLRKASVAKATLAAAAATSAAEGSARREREKELALQSQHRWTEEVRRHRDLVAGFEAELSQELDLLGAAPRSDVLTRFESMVEAQRQAQQDLLGARQRLEQARAERERLTQQWGDWELTQRDAERAHQERAHQLGQIETASTRLLHELAAVGIAEPTARQGLLALERLLVANGLQHDERGRRKELLLADLEANRAAEDRHERERFAALDWDKQRSLAELRVQEAQHGLLGALHGAGFEGATLEEALAARDAALQAQQVDRTIDAERLASTRAQRERLLEAWARFEAAQRRKDEWLRQEYGLKAAAQRCSAELSSLVRDVAQRMEPEFEGFDEDASMLDNYRALLHDVELRNRSAAMRHEQVALLDAERQTAERLETERDSWRDARRALSTDLKALTTATCSVADAGDLAPDECVELLSAWHSEVRAAEGRESVRQSAADELMGLLQGGSLPELQDRLDAADHVISQLGSTEDEQPTSPSLDEAERSLAEARQHFAELRGQCAHDETRLPDVAQAEEALFAANARLARLHDLAMVLDTAATCLDIARTETHASLAPVLSRDVSELIEKVTDGRYKSASVDPSTLEVSIELPTGRMVPLRLLSYGTTEQVYLLLRMVLTDRLVTTGETAPLFFDEVLSSSDELRTTRLLDLLKVASQDRQIIVFGHERRLLEWAESHLDGDHIIRLDAPSSA